MSAADLATYALISVLCFSVVGGILFSMFVSKPPQPRSRSRGGFTRGFGDVTADGDGSSD